MLKKIFIGLFIPALALAQPRLDTTSSSLSASNARVTQVIFADGTTQTTAGVSGNTTVTNLPDTLVYRNISNAWSAAQTLPAGSTILGATFGLDHWASDTGTATQVGSWFYPTNGSTAVGFFVGTNGSISAVRPGGGSSGNARSLNSLDLQIERNSATQIAGGTRRNTLIGTYRATISGGSGHVILGGREAGTGGGIISGGEGHFIAASGGVAGGSISSSGAGNSLISDAAGIISGSASISVILAGVGGNEISGSTVGSIIGAGFDNDITAGQAHVIFAGRHNRASGSTILGSGSAIIGGYRTTNTVEGVISMGHYVNNDHRGSFAYSHYDGTTTRWATTASNQAIWRVQNGFGINTNNPQAMLHVAGDARVDGNLAVNGNQVTMDGFDVIKYNSGNTGRASINSAASAPSAGTYNAIISNRDSGSSVASAGGGNVILGGSQGANTISGTYSDSVILGGGFNDVVAANNVIIAGGYDNEIRGTGNAQGYGIYNSRSSRLYAPAGVDSSVIIGGLNSVISNSYGSILLKRGTVQHNNVFMYSDSGAFVSGNSNAVLFNASNGFGINTNNPQADLHVNGMVQIDGVKVYASGTNLYLTDGSSFTNLITTTPL